MIKVTFDNHVIEVEAGTTILNAARKVGGKIVPPAMCYYTTLHGSGGKCRTCLVKVTQSSANDTRPMPKLIASCVTPVQDGMVVENSINDEVLKARKGIVEFLLLNHPLDCPICDQAGECDLQDFTYQHGLAFGRTEEKRREFDKIDIGPNIKLHMTRCILCFRCTQVADQLCNSRVHGMIGRGDVTEISTYISNVIDQDFSGNMIDVCPVGALTDKTFRFKDRVWFTKPVDAHRNCSKCCGRVVLWMHGEDIRRITGRKDEYNELKEFICNECRFEKKEVTDWTIEGPRTIKRGSVIAQNHYTPEPKEEHVSVKLAAKS